MEERARTLRANRKSKVQPSQQDRRKKRPKQQPGDSYTTDQYEAVHFLRLGAVLPPVIPPHPRQGAGDQFGNGQVGSDVLGQLSARGPPFGYQPVLFVLRFIAPVAAQVMVATVERHYGLARSPVLAVTRITGRT